MIATFPFTKHPSQGQPLGFMRREARFLSRSVGYGSTLQLQAEVAPIGGFESTTKYVFFNYGLQFSPFSYWQLR